MDSSATFLGRLGPWLLLGMAGVLACFLALPYAGGWNDGSRLATVESLVDYHTLAIDRSIFVQPALANAPPYAPDQPDLLAQGTGDKLLVQGHYYSDKSPVPAVLMAGAYQVEQWLTGWTAREQPAAFCYSLTILFAGVPYLLALGCAWHIARRLGLPVGWCLALTASLAIATVALPYVRTVNNHILLLAMMAGIMDGCLELQAACSHDRPVKAILVFLGGLTGLGYAVDLGVGPVLVATTLALVAFRVRRAAGIALFLASAAPAILLHHALNYSVGGTFKPANAVPEYFQWPGSSFNAQNMTGAWNHSSVGHFLVYALALLVGKRGFLGHNLPLFLALAALPRLLRREPSQRPELLYASCLSGGIWLAYGLTSTNYSGLCCSIRWFVPLLAPGYYVLALGLRQGGAWRGAFVILAGWGTVLAASMAAVGPWTRHLVPWFWPIQAGALLTLLGYAWWQRRIALPEAQPAAIAPPARAA